MRRSRIHRKDAEGAEVAQRRGAISLRDLCGLCFSALNSPPWVRFALILISATISLVLLNARSVAPAVTTTPQGKDQEYAKFLHSSQRHAALLWSSCQRRNDSSAH